VGAWACLTTRAFSPAYHAHELTPPPCTTILRSTRALPRHTRTRAHRSYAHGVDGDALALSRHVHAYRKTVLSTTAPGTADRRHLLSLMGSLSPELPVEEVLTRLTATLAAAFAAESVTVWLVDRPSGSPATAPPSSLLLKSAAGPPGLVALRGARLRLAASGLVGAAAVGGSPVNVSDCYADPRFNRALDKAAGTRTGSTLAAPVRWPPHRGGSVIAVVQVTNKLSPAQLAIAAAAARGGSGGSSGPLASPTLGGGGSGGGGGAPQPFTAHDERLMDSVIVHVGAALARLGHELALDAGLASASVPCWKLTVPLRLYALGATNIALERRRTLLGGYTCAKALSLRVELFHGESRLCEPLTTPEVPVAITRMLADGGGGNGVSPTNGGGAFPSAAGGSVPPTPAFGPAAGRGRAPSSLAGFGGGAGGEFDGLGGDEFSGLNGGDSMDDDYVRRALVDRLYGIEGDPGAAGDGFYGTGPSGHAAVPPHFWGGGAQQQQQAAAAPGGGGKEGAAASAAASKEAKRFARASADLRCRLGSELSIRNLPRATRVIFTLIADGKDAVAWAGASLFDYASALCTGPLSLPLWPGACPTPLTTHLANTYGTPEETGVLTVAIEDPAPGRTCVYTDHGAGDAEAAVAAAVAAATGGAGAGGPRRSGGRPQSLTLSPSPSDGGAGGLLPPSLASQLLPLSEVLRRDPLAPLSPSDKAALWSNRYALTAIPGALPKFLRSVPWANREAVAETHALLALWPPLPPEAALQLLDVHFPDPRVRAWAVDCLEPLSDEQLAVYSLQVREAD
jgi:hypothetical protein